MATSRRPASTAQAGAQRGWWLEDASPGGVLRHPGGRTISEGEHVWLAWVTHNISDIHGNADAARRSEWGQPLVLGVLTAAIVIGLAEPATGPPGSAAASLQVEWSSITLEGSVVAGDTLRAESYIERVEADAIDSGRVWRTIVGLVRDGEVVARIRDERRVLRRRSALAGP